MGPRQSGDPYVFGLSALSQANDYFFARERESFFFRFFFARKREKKLVFFRLFWCFCAFGGVFLCFWGVFFVFRALARFFLFFFRCCSNYFSR